MDLVGRGLPGVSSAEWIGIFGLASGTLLLQVSTQLLLGHWLRSRGQSIPKESLFLVALYAGVPILAWVFHHNAHLMLLSVSLGLSYVLGFNPASGIRSPSFRMLGVLASAKTPVPSSAFLTELKKDQILERKLNDLVSDGWITVKGNQAQLSFLARAMVSVFALFRSALYLREGTG